MPEPTRAWSVKVTAEYEIGAACSWDAAMRVTEALRTGGMPWPVAVRIEVNEDA